MIKRSLQQLLFAALILPILSPSNTANAQEQLSQIVEDAKIHLQLRYRSEYVDQDSFAVDAKASTLRTRIGVRSGTWYGLSALLEADDVSELGPDEYNGGGGTTPDRTNFPLVPDPADTRINQAYLNYQWDDAFRLRAGRQRIKWDNDRFIGNVGWRQNEQTYDAVSSQFKHNQISLDYAYIFNTNRIFGSEVAAGDHEHNTHIARAQWTVSSLHKIIGYFHHIDNEDSPAASSNNYGLRYLGDASLGTLPISLTAEYAHQTDTANNPVNYSANYWHGNIAFKFDPLFNFNTGLEILSGDERNGRAFRTPLATLHAFNGWSDQFIQTPTLGLQDFFSGIKGKYQDVSWQLHWHYFQTEVNHNKIGTEWNAAINYKLHDNVSLLLKAAFFDSDSVAFSDTNKVWTMLTYQL